MTSKEERRRYLGVAEGDDAGLELIIGDGGVIARVGAKARKLILEILRSLSCQTGRGRVTLRRCAVAPGAIFDTGALRSTCNRGNHKATDCESRNPWSGAYHDLNSTVFAFSSETYFR